MYENAQRLMNENAVRVKQEFDAKYVAGAVLGGLAAQRQPEILGLLEHLAKEVASAEVAFAELRDRVSGLTRPEEPTPAGNPIAPQSVPNTNMGAELRNLVNRIDELTGNMRSVIRRLEV